jgi:hypothetical protein
MKEIISAFVRAQKAFAPALKTSTNPHYKTRYADLAACIEAVIDALNAQSIALVQRTHDSDNGVAVETLFIHESGETLSGGIFHVPAAKQDPQGYGSALTYARRYSLMSACGIAPEDDDAESSKSPPNGVPRPIPRVTPKEEPKAARTLEELAPLVVETKNLAELTILWTNLSPEEKATAKEMVSLRKNEFIKKDKA